MSGDHGPREVRVTDLMDLPDGPHGAPDEVGPPEVETCTCGVSFEPGHAHRCGHVGEWITWDRYQARQEVSDGA